MPIQCGTFVPHQSGTSLIHSQRVAKCLAEEAEAEWQSHFRIFQSNRTLWVPYHCNSPVWTFFQLLDGSGGGRVSASILQTMRKASLGNPNERKDEEEEKEVHPSFSDCRFLWKAAYKKLDLPQVNFLQNLVLLIAKGCIPLSLVEIQWVRRLVFMCDLRVNFPSGKQLVREHIPAMFTKTMESAIGRKVCQS